MFPTHIASRRSAPESTDSLPLDCLTADKSRHTGVSPPMLRDVFQNCLDYKRLVVKDGPFYTSTGLHGRHRFVACVDREKIYGRHVAIAAAQELVTPLQRRAPEQFSGPSTHDCSRRTVLRNWSRGSCDISMQIFRWRHWRGVPAFRNGIFQSRLQKRFGTSPLTLSRTCRLNEARRRLSTRQKTLYSVAESVGFKSADAFHRAFERRFGTRPSKYNAGSQRFSDVEPKLAVVSR